MHISLNIERHVLLENLQGAPHNTGETEHFWEFVCVPFFPTVLNETISTQCHEHLHVVMKQHQDDPGLKH